MSEFSKKSENKPVPERNEKGHYYITQKYCSELSEYNGYYYSPQNNSNLHLHYKGFSKIENLEAFVNIKVLYLENNCIQKIENLSHMKHLSCLYLNNNYISKLENLDENNQISLLNVSGNRITKIENLGKLTKLNNLYMDKNLLKDVECVKEILECPSISVLDIQNNYIESGHEELIKIFNRMPSLSVLYLKNNPVTRHIPYYRKTLIKEIEHLSYLDDRPIDLGDRLASEAFFVGGLEAEKRAREDFRKSKDIGYKIRQQEADVDKEPFEERKRKALQSLKTEYLARKDTLENKKRKLLQEYEICEDLDKKKKLTRELLSVDYQIEENEKFKIKEEDNVIATIGKREKVDRFKTFEYEDWMEPLFEKHTVENLFDFDIATKLIKLDLKNRGITNWELFNELDLRSKWTEIELKKFRQNEEDVGDFGVYQQEESKSNYLAEKNTIQIKEDVIDENEFEDYENYTNKENLDLNRNKNNKIDLTPNKMIENINTKDTFGNANRSEKNTKKNNIPKNQIFEEEEIVTTFMPGNNSTKPTSYDDLD